MSRVGSSPISLPSGVEVKVDGNKVAIKGPKGELSREIHEDIKIEIEESMINFIRPTEQKRHKALHGLTRSLVNNMVVGVTKGFDKELQVVGVGYRAAQQGNKLVLTVGFSHPVEMEMPKGIDLEVDNNKIVIKGMDKQLVGEIAANIRKVRPPEPYKGKGIRYKDERVRRKEGKIGVAKV